MMSRRTERRKAAFAGMSSHERQVHLKERIYGAFACLAVLLALASHGDHSSSQSQALGGMLNVAIALVSLWFASLFAEVLSHLALSGAMPHGREWRVMLTATWQIVAAGFAPILLLALAAAGVWGFQAATVASICVVVASLGVFSMLAARRTALPIWKQLLLAVVLMAFGGIVVALKYLAH